MAGFGWKSDPRLRLAAAQRCNLRQAMRAFEKLSRAATQQQQAFVSEMGRAMERYAPGRLGGDGPA